MILVSDALTDERIRCLMARLRLLHGDINFGDINFFGAAGQHIPAHHSNLAHSFFLCQARFTAGVLAVPRV